MEDLTFSSVTELSRKLQAREVSAVELARHYLDRIEAHRDLNAFLDVRPEATLAEAREADERIAAGNAGPLTGIPIAHKDIFVTKNWASTAASKMLEGYMSPFDATVVRKLREAGMVCLGKLNCDEFAMGSGNENSAYGRVHNPWDPNAVPGGSSGGSSACVAAGLAPIATGTDTGGSIREPASFTGLTGVKPTYGRPSRFGMIAFASSLDTAGLLAHSAEDCAAVLGSMVGFDPADSTSVDRPTEDFSRSLTQGMEGIRIGVPRSWMGKGLDPEVAARALTDFEAGRVRVLCCTIKLGMGYDKADIRFVINFQLPENLISYYQQIGRAGRDGKRAWAVLLHGPEDEGILRSFIDSAFAEPDLLEKIIDRCSSGATQREVMASVNATAGKVKEALKYLQVHGYLYQEKRKNQRGSMATMFCVNEDASFDAQAERERQAELCATRQDELASFREFLRTDGCLMKYIADELDAPDAKEHCGICANCTGEPLFPVEVDEVLVDEAISFERNRHGFVKPRKQWPDGTRIAPEEQCGRGWILSDNYFSLLGQLAATGKYRDGRFSDELLLESARYLRSAAAGTGIDAVVAVPSLRRPTLVPDFAERLAHALKVPFVDGAVRKIAEGVAQKTLNSSALQVKNIHDTIEVAKPGRIAGKTVLLVDDMVDSGWTFAMIASELVRAGAKAVYPYALVKTGKGD